MAAEIDGEARAKALSALAAGESVSAAARTAGYTRQHLHRLLKEQGFTAELAARRDELLGVRTAAGGPSDAELARLERIAVRQLERLTCGTITRRPAPPGQEPGQDQMRQAIDIAKIQAAAANTLLRHVIACRGRAPRAGQLKVRGSALAPDGSGKELEVTAKGDDLVKQMAGLLQRLG